MDEQEKNELYETKIQLKYCLEALEEAIPWIGVSKFGPSLAPDNIRVENRNTCNKVLAKTQNAYLIATKFLEERGL
jgi:hypothetical protein